MSGNDNYNIYNLNNKKLSIGNSKKNYYENYDEKFNILKEKLKREQNQNYEN
jgi:hypothetical protein